MATVDLTVGGTTGAASNLSGRIFTHFKELDFSVTGRTAADVLQLFDIPAGSYVLTVSWEVVTAEGGTFTFDLGDGAAPTQYQSNADGNVVARGVSASTTSKLYSTADTIDMVVDHTVDAAKVRVWAVILDFNV